jgi:3-methyladenine DNA glycosylase AlkD
VTRRAVAALQHRLAAASDERTRLWWERYLRGAVPFRGVPMARIRAAVHAWWKDEAFDEFPPLARKELAYALLRERAAEDKIAGVLVLREILLPELGLRDLPALRALFADGSIADWNTCDWFCVKVLGTLVQRSPERERIARRIAGWHRAETVWQRRASVVAFVNLAPRGEANFPGFTSMLLESCAAVVRGKERFAQTAVGWSLRELAQAEPRRVEAFIREHLARLSPEALRAATEKMPDAVRRELVRSRGRVAEAV